MDGDLNACAGFRRLRDDDETGDVADDSADGGVGVCEEEEELSEKAGRKMGRREPTIGVMLSKDSISVCMGGGANTRRWGKGDGVGWYGMEAARAGEHRYTHCRATVYDHNATNAVSEVPARMGCGVYGIRVAKGGVRFTIRIDRC